MDKLLLPRDFGPTPLPAKFKPSERWQRQVELAHDLADRLNRVDVVFFQAPTGTGKTLIAELVRRIRSNSSALYACTTKSLQDQFSSDFTYGRVIKGRSNYLTQYGAADEYGQPVEPFSIDCVTAADCNYALEECTYCDIPHACEYRVNRARAQSAELAVLNSSYMLTDFIKGQGRFKGRDLIIVDEADEIESELLNQTEVVISERMQRLMNLSPPFRKTKPESWIEWLNKQAIPQVQRFAARMPKRNLKEVRRAERVNNLLDKLYVLRTELPLGNWVYDGYNRRTIIFRPIHLGRYGRSLWENGKKFLLMSASILSADLMAHDLGYTSYYDFVEIGSDFPVANRPVYIAPVANMVFAEKDTEWPKMAAGILGVLDQHPTERVLVHTVSYALAAYLYRAIEEHTDRPLMTYLSSSDRDETLKAYKQTEGAVLLAPSMTRGIDLPDDLCRVQVIAKVPWPNTADKRINARMYQKFGTEWYRSQAVREVVQMTGRGVRHPEDHAVTYILDKQFRNNLWANAKHLFPAWWTEALDRRYNVRKLTKPTQHLTIQSV